MNKYLVTGAPGSGKSTYVKEHHGENDVIFDWDNLFVAITGMKSHSEGTEGQRHVVNRLRFDLIRAADNADGLDSLWMIAAKPSDTLRDALGDYEEIHLDVSEDEAKERVDADNTREDKDAEHNKIAKYFEEDRSMPAKTDREYRNMRIEARAAEDETGRMIVNGYATTFDEPYLLFSGEGWEYWEIVDRGAFDSTDMTDVIMQYDHEGRVFARNKNGTLDVKPDERGLLISADLSGTELGRQVYSEIKGGYTDKMSFGFTVSDEYEDRVVRNEKSIYTRHITGIKKLYDVSAVSIPANDNTGITADATARSVRDAVNGLIDRIEAERLQEERDALERKRLQVRAKALGRRK